MGGRTHGKTTKIVLEEIRAVHGDKFLYDKFEYTNCNTKVTVGCREHGYFEKWPNDLKKSTSGCPKCNNSWKKTHKEFVVDLPSHIQCLSTYKNAVTELEFVCTKHNYHFTAQPNSIRAGHINCPECSAEKSLSSKLENSKSVIDPATKTEFEVYKRAVWRFSNRSYKQHMSEQKRNRKNHLDHILSIVEGYQNNIPPEVVGSIHNLRIISGTDNQKKSYRSDITVKELLEKYEKTILCRT